ncbi:DUF1826 domain-containing protein [Sorangium sp. So ce1014]
MVTVRLVRTYVGPGTEWADDARCHRGGLRARSVTPRCSSRPATG